VAAADLICTVLPSVPDGPELLVRVDSAIAIIREGVVKVHHIKVGPGSARGENVVIAW
jgi:hypothetical protein